MCSLKMRGNRCSSGRPRFNNLSPPEAPGATVIGGNECKSYSDSAPHRLLSLVFLLVCMFLLQSNKRHQILGANLLHQDGEKGRSRTGTISSTAGPAFSRMHRFFSQSPQLLSMGHSHPAMTWVNCRPPGACAKADQIRSNPGMWACRAQVPHSLMGLVVQGRDRIECAAKGS